MRKFLRTPLKISLIPLIAIALLKLPQWHRQWLWSQTAPVVYKITHINNYSVGGTGFLVKHKSKSYIITNSHVCFGADKEGFVAAHLPMGVAHLKYVVDKSVDLCIMESDLPGGLSLSDSGDNLEDVFVVGHGGLNPLKFLPGILGREESVFVAGYYYLAVPLTARIAPGNSGSPVINMWGRVVGVVFAGSVFEGLMIPVKSLREFLEAIK